MIGWIPNREGDQGRRKARLEGVCAGACFALIASILCFAQMHTPPPEGYHPEKDATAQSPINQRPDANRLAEMKNSRVRQQQFSAANTERKRQMSQDSARLLQLAAELHAELARVGDAELPPAATARAGMIEQLAHAVKEKMKLTVAQ